MKSLQAKNNLGLLTYHLNIDPFTKFQASRTRTKTKNWMVK